MSTAARRTEAALPPESAERAIDVAVDLLLQRAALLARVQRNRIPDPLAGLKVDDEDLAALLEELPGLEPGDGATAAEIEAQLAAPLGEARVALAAAFAGEHRLARVVRTARLDPLAAEVLALTCAIEADPRRQRLVGYLNDDVTARRLTLASLALVIGHSAALGAVCGPGGALRRAGLLLAPAEGPFAAAGLVPAPALMWWLAGDEELDPELPAGCTVAPTPRSGSAALAVAAGPDRTRRLEAALGALGASQALVAPLPTSDGAWDALVRAATLRAAAVVLECGRELPAAARDRIERAEHLAWAVTSPAELPLDQLFRRPWTEVTVAPALASTAEWAAAFPAAGDALADLAAAYRLSADQLALVRAAAAARDGDLANAVRRLAAGSIESTAVRIRPSRRWEDLVLEEHRLASVREIAVRQRQRRLVFDEWGFSAKPSSGVVALFAGPSGTGKTLAAEIIAGELGVDLYKVDLANLVSKYIGETEKNLAQVFAAAEASRVVLFFDEADALLGKRSEVSDSHDRYANIEVAYLLQRLEIFDGVAVLATNLANNLDTAFLRRLHVIVEFPLPAAPERRRIWAQSLPAAAPLADDLDLDRLAEEVEISGGTIRNAALRGAFLAAEANSAITMEVMVTALRRELEKLGRLSSSSQWQRIFEG